jgi:uncharacterized protein (TIGR03118 family)
MHRVCFRASWVILTVAFAAGPVLAQSRFVETDLVSDVQGLANHFDPNLKNPWGISQTGGTFWVSDNANGLSTLYGTDGTPRGLIVTIPPAPGSPVGALGTPTGQVFNNTADFGGNAFLFASLDGTISGWKSGTAATPGVTVAGASYTGLASGNNGSGNFLYAANQNGNIDVFDKNIALTTLAGHFVDPNGLPAGFTANNIQNLGGSLYVTYANPNGTSGGVVDKFDLNGNFLQRIASNGIGGPLDQAWGLAIAPQGFGSFSGDLLVGNNGGDFHINAFNTTTGKFDGALTLASGKAFSEDGLWGLQFDARGNTPNTLYFAAGINGEADGLLGSLTVAAVPEPSAFVLLGLGGTFALVLRRRLARKG